MKIERISLEGARRVAVEGKLFTVATRDLLFVCTRSSGIRTKFASNCIMSRIGLVGLAVMGQNLALNIAEKGFKISVWNRSYDKVETTVKRAQAEGCGDNLIGFQHLNEFISSLERPRSVQKLVDC